MEKKRRQTNPELFMAEDSKSIHKKCTKPPKHHQQEEELISSGLSSKILKEAQIQQKELEEEERLQDPNKLVFRDESNDAAIAEEDDVEDFVGFSETQSFVGGEEETIDENDEKLLEVFFSKDVQSQRTLAKFYP